MRIVMKTKDGVLVSDKPVSPQWEFMYNESLALKKSGYFDKEFFEKVLSQIGKEKGVRIVSSKMVGDDLIVLVDWLKGSKK